MIIGKSKFISKGTIYLERKINSIKLKKAFKTKNLNVFFYYPKPKGDFMKKPRFKNWRLFATLALLGQTIGGTIGPTIAFADEITHPQTVTVD